MASAAGNKENPTQTLLQFPSKGNESKKRVLNVKNVELNLTESTIPVTKEVVEAMRKRIIELEDALADHPPAKRKKTTEANEKMVSSTSPDKTTVKVDQKKVDVLLKKFWASLQKDVKTEKYKFKGGAPKAVRVEQVIEEDEFHAIFDGKGFQIQPTPSNKPTSSITIKEFNNSDDIEALFGKHFKDLKGNRYLSGGGFERDSKAGLVSLKINNLTINYAKNTMKCSMKFEVEEAEPWLGPTRSWGWFRA